MIGAFLGFITGVVLTVTLIWPWSGSFVPSVGGSAWQIILAGIGGVLAAVVSFFIGLLLIGPFIGLIAKRLIGTTDSNRVAYYGSYGGSFAFWTSIFAFSFILGRYLGDTGGRILVCIGPGLGITAISAILGASIDQRFSRYNESVEQEKQRKKEETEKQKREVIEMIDEALKGKQEEQ